MNNTITLDWEKKREATFTMHQNFDSTTTIKVKLDAELEKTYGEQELKMDENNRVLPMQLFTPGKIGPQFQFYLAGVIQQHLSINSSLPNEQ
jgi:hypothetical protein